MNKKTNKIGAYVLTHESSGLFYVGSSKNITNRIYQHKTLLNNGNHRSKELQEVFDNDPGLTVKRIETENREEAFDLEQKLLDENRNNPKMVNIAIDARLSSKGLKHSEEHKAKISVANVGRKHTEEAKEKISIAHKNVCKDIQRETFIALNKSRAGIPLSDERKAVISQQHKGVPFSEEHKAKIALAHNGKKHTTEHRANLSKSREGFTHSEEAKARIKASMIATMAKKRLNSLSSV